MGTYQTIKAALIANGYATESATKIAKRLAKRKDPIAAFNEEYTQ